MASVASADLLDLALGVVGGVVSRGGDDFEALERVAGMMLGRKGEEERREGSVE